MSLHLIFSPTGAEACLDRCSPDDRLVLLGDGVYAANQLTQSPVSAAAIDMMASDAEARGITKSERGDIRRIDYKQLVGLTEEHSPIVSWHD
jgi:sulfur relay protein TusB/DsrH|tara:strand:- start:1104 stop:1379 length:276 start_codon:yes stop_codon:yes gene_type:complete